MAAPGQARWTLRHGWSSHSDLEALQYCGAALAKAGVAFGQCSIAPDGDAVKMHGYDLIEAVAAPDSAVRSLDASAVKWKWRQRVPTFMRRYMVHGERWYGIPMGIHRGNVAWVNSEIAQRLGAQPPASFSELLTWLGEAQRHISGGPLAISSAPWQVGMLFESTVLAVAGPMFYRQAFEAMQSSAWRSNAMIESLQSMLALREFVRDECLTLTWRELVDHVAEGQCALQVMGDWVRPSAGTGLSEWAVPGTSGKFLAIMDFFVPLHHARNDISDVVAGLLTTADCQLGYARKKGCMPAMVDAWNDCDPLRARLLSYADRSVFASLTFDQCCAASKREAMLALISDFFVQRLDAKQCTEALAEVVAQG
ncbi:hypothetical protein [Piscinibacter sp. HJYY11]|uniref:hypothetical protein n=1 Tax=Piscinibacter sp. HJYY11 TaxID=2801333 RepID=UPI00191F6666|nr:hypothetical protein [Piscinibacter sp. HJYY11]MBL0729628.1 hypothetical protein [Piscinibacter sp. HJYY11]